ncbi:transglycosylase domain-containing protein [Ornithinibacillus halotolerans]|uniref:Penicillin-binding protein 2D n=1 Tax=Ornithinibacillus halotolerans TaxID=1274357 RepID=A0A916W3A6_9BACI|nr:transglycosylase domain-containing protein [Ornithinibacillus halotolerans]GGA63992.1 penicillin-binding protein 2D [Ornithinibacillus halotolerans]
MIKPFSKKTKRILLKTTVGLALMFVSTIVFIYLLAFLLGPPSLLNEQNTIYYSKDGTVIGEEQGVENRHWIDLEDMSPHFIDATLMIEDQHFYEHHGFDFKRIIGAILKDIKTMSLKEGASTLTQQYARNLYLSHEKTWARKIKEAFYAIRLEMYYSKDEILEGYLNTVYYGHGAYGIEAASHHFFNKKASELTIAEAAMLAGVPKGPTYYSPLNDEERATNRQKQILAVMHKEQVITDDEYELATKEQLTYADPKERIQLTVGPYFQDTVLAEAAKLLDIEQELVRSGGYEIHTTLDTQLQTQLEESVRSNINQSSEIQVAAIAIEPNNGAIRALVGGRDYRESPFNRAIQAKRMPGSSFKPFLYYSALENGYTATTMLMSKPTTFEIEDGQVYQPSNFNGYYANEPITLAQALAVSDNIYAVKTNMYLGAEKLVETARKFGIKSKLPAVPSLALGTATVSVQEMVTGYGMLANGGYHIDGHSIEKIVDREGHTVYEKEDGKKELTLDPQKAFILTQLMTGMFDESLNGYMSVTGSSIVDRISRTYAGKTGSTDSDTWMIGFSPSLVTGVWTGYDDNRTITHVPERAYSKEIWTAFMESAHKGEPEEHFKAPEGLVAVPVDPTTGLQATPHCPTSTVMFFEEGTEPDFHCSDHFYGEEIDQTEKEKGMFQRWFEVFFD